MKNLDDVLKKSLTPAESEEGPDFWLNQNILKRADRQERGAKTMKKRTYRPTKAVAALVIALSISGSAVFAAEKTNLFGNLFGETNMGPVESYVNDTGANENTKASYHYQGAEYKVQIDKVVRSAATHSGAVCVIDLHKTVLVGIPENDFLAETAQMHHDCGHGRK